MNLHCQIKVEARGAAPPPSSKEMQEAAIAELGIYGGMSRNSNEDKAGYAMISFDPHTIGASDELEQICRFARKQCREPYHHWSVTFTGVDE